MENIEMNTALVKRKSISKSSHLWTKMASKRSKGIKFSFWKPYLIYDTEYSVPVLHYIKIFGRIIWYLTNPVILMYSIRKYQRLWSQIMFILMESMEFVENPNI